MSKYKPGTRSDVQTGKSVTLADFTVGGKAYVFAFGYWYEGTVIRISKTRVEVRFTTGSGLEHARWFHPADGRHVGTATTELHINGGV